MPSLSKTDEADLLLRVLECATQSDGWASILDSIDAKLNCISVLCEFENNGIPTPNFDGGRSSRKLHDMLFSEPAQRGDDALRFLLTEAELSYPYCKATLRKGDFGRNRPVLNHPQKDGGPPGLTYPENESVSHGEDSGHAESAGLISPLSRDAKSTILFGCLFKEHTTETIDVETARKTFRTLTRVLKPGLDAFFQIERHKAQMRIQDALLSSIASPSVLMTKDKVLLGHAASGLEKLLATGSVKFKAPRFDFRNKQLEAGLQHVVDTFAGNTHTALQHGHTDAPADRSGDQSVWFEDPKGQLKRITIEAVPATGTSKNGGSAPWLILKIFETSELPEALETVLQERFELSYSEAHLARHLTMSGSMNDTVQELGITKNTAKTHLRRIFDKTGVNTQLQLAKLVHGLSSLF